MPSKSVLVFTDFDQPQTLPGGDAMPLRGKRKRRCISAPGMPRLETTIDGVAMDIMTPVGVVEVQKKNTKVGVVVHFCYVVTCLSTQKI
ncbi:hypothetical protein L1987_46992 [Smallanthus sonchifolius]|uniref:Uncharacterized protein n=1 Tax=Smallanthus sonchifolius TaxID=185202 RepID=A0ACB9G2A0_9ASTR|nr:hypothetical protein L1987_46992 [Smallanthus sonchifolius]